MFSMALLFSQPLKVEGLLSPHITSSNSSLNSVHCSLRFLSEATSFLHCCSHHLPEFSVSRLLPHFLFQIPRGLSPQIAKLNVAAPCWKRFPGCPSLLLSSPATSFPASSLICALSPLLATFPGIFKTGHICAVVPSASNICPSWLAWKTPPPLHHILAPVPALLGNLPLFLSPHHPAFVAASSEYPNP